MSDFAHTDTPLSANSEFWWYQMQYLLDLNLFDAEVYEEDAWNKRYGHLNVPYPSHTPNSN